MASFRPGQTITTRTPRVTVDAGLPVGVHRFQLVVLTDTGQRSAADVVQVSVTRTQVVEPLRPVEPVSPVLVPTRPPIRREP